MEQLLITTLYPENSDITRELFQLITTSKCHLKHAHLSPTGTTFQVVTLILSGSWNQLTLFETRFSLLQKQHHFDALIQKAMTQPSLHTSLPYNTYIIAPETSNSINLIIGFLTDFNISVYDLLVTNYKAPFSDMPMLETNLSFLLPKDTSIHYFRENILHFGDEHNLEIILEPKRS